MLILQFPHLNYWKGKSEHCLGNFWFTISVFQTLGNMMLFIYTPTTWQPFSYGNDIHNWKWLVQEGWQRYGSFQSSPSQKSRNLTVNLPQSALSLWLQGSHRCDRHERYHHQEDTPMCVWGGRFLCLDFIFLCHNQCSSTTPRILTWEKLKSPSVTAH